MPRNPKTKEADLTAQNASTLAELAVDPLTTESSRVQILQLLMDSASERDFFVTMLKEGLSEGDCPECGHTNHWLVPEDILNQMGWVSYEEDDRVKKHTTKDDCETYAEACIKKKTIY